MYCRNCGASVSPDDPFCGSCGTPTDSSPESRSVHIPESRSAPRIELPPATGFAELEIAAGPARVRGSVATLYSIRLSWQRLLRLSFTLLTLTLAAFALYGFLNNYKDIWQIFSGAALCGIILRLSITFYHKTYVIATLRYAQRVRVVEKIGRDAEFARDAIRALRLVSDNLDGHLSPDVASAIDDDPFLKSTWKDAHKELQHLYAVLGPPPMKSSLRTRSA